MSDSCSEFCLPPGYESRSVALSKDGHSQGPYWNAQRLAAARHYQFPVYKFAARIMTCRSLVSLLDVGCGVGAKLRYVRRKVPNLNVTGVDQSGPIEYCRSTYDFGTWLVDDLENPTVTDWPSAELTICADVIEHLSDPDCLLAALKNVCGEAGLLLISTPDRERLYGSGRLSPGHSHHVREWSQAEFRRYVESRGFAVIKQFVTSPVRLTPSITLLRELWKQLSPGRRFKYNQICLATTDG